MTRHILFATLVAAMASLTGCDIIEGPKVDPNGFTGSTNKVLIEDFTGHMCGNCPRAHEEAAALKETYGENVVVIAVHASGFSRVIPPLGYTYDFNTDMGAELEDYYNAEATSGLPIGMVDRRSWGGGPLSEYGEWSSNVATVLAESPKMSIEVVPTYTDSDRKLDVDVNLRYFTGGTANHQVVVVITEDSIISRQADYSIPAQHIDDYVHMHVLRGVVTPGGTWGTPVKGNDIVIGEEFNLNFNTTLDPVWVPKNCHVVAYVQDNATKEVLQVEEVKLLQ